MAEQQAGHRRKLETMALEANIPSERRGSVFSFVLSLIVIIGGFWLIASGKDVLGLVAVLGSLASLVAVFVYGRYAQSKERSEKMKLSAPLPETTK